MTGEYVVEVRDAGTDPGDPQVWRPSLAFDPVPDANTLATERMVEDMREQVRKLNRSAGWYQFRTRYVPPEPDPDPFDQDNDARADR